MTSQGLPAGTLLVVHSGGEAIPGLAAAFAAVGTSVHEATLGAPEPPAPEAEDVGGTQHRLRAGDTPSRWRRPVLMTLDRIAPRSLRARYAARFDPWFRTTLRTVDALVVIGPGSAAIASVADRVDPTTPVHLGPAGLHRVAMGRAVDALAGVLRAPAHQADTSRTGQVLGALWLLRLCRDGGAVLDRSLLEQLRSLPWRVDAGEGQEQVLSSLTEILGVDDPVLMAWSVRQTLRAGEAVSEDLGRVGGRLLRSVDLSSGDPDTGGVGTQTSAEFGRMMVERAALALEVLFPPAALAEISPVLRGPQAHLAPARATRLWQQLTTPVPLAEQAAAVPHSQNLRVHLLPGPDAETQSALRECLRVGPMVEVTGWRRTDLPPRLRGGAPSAYLVGRRVAHARGETWTAQDEITAAVQGEAAPDVLVVLRADRTALALTLMIRRPARLLLRVDAADLALPWVHLLDWGRVDGVLVDEPTVLSRLHTIVGAAAHAVPGQVLDLRDLGHPETSGRVRELVLGDLGRLSELTAQGRHEEAAGLAGRVLEDPAATSASLQQAALSATRAGEVTLRLAILRRWADGPGGPHPRRQHLVRQQEGRLRELTPGWLPGDLPRSRVDSIPGRVMHLLKASLPHRTSGYAVRSYYLLREQARAGTDVLAVTALDFPEDGSSDTELVGGVTHLRLLREQVPEQEYRDDYQAAFARALLEMVRKHRPAVLHAHSGHRGFDLALIALAVGRSTGIPVVYEVRGLFEAVWTSDVARASSAELYRRRIEMEAHCLAKSDAVVTLSESMREEILARADTPDAPLAPERVFVVPNGVDPDSIRPRPRRADIARRHGVDGGFTFGYVSNLDHPREGQEVLVEAVRILQDRGLPATALLVGGGSRRDELETLAETLGVTPRVIFTGPVPHDEVGDYYALLDVFVVPRIDERAARLVTPLKPYEAMSMGLPVVVSDLPALREIISSDSAPEGARGLAFPPGDAEALAEVLQRLSTDGALRDRLATAGRSWVAEHRTWQSLATRYEAVYARATGEPGIPGR